jgi:uncharacterized protein (DUF58 family)
MASPTGSELLSADFVRELFVLRFARLCEELRGWARRHRAAYIRVRTDEPLEAAVRRFVARSVD